MSPEHGQPVMCADAAAIHAKPPIGTISASGTDVGVGILSYEPPALSVVTVQPDSSRDAVVAAVRAEFEAAPAAAERPGLSAAALALARILDNPRA